MLSTCPLAFGGLTQIKEPSPMLFYSNYEKNNCLQIQKIQLFFLK